MRIRTAAIAGASAVAVALSGATAVAQTEPAGSSFGSSTFDGSEADNTGVYDEGAEKDGQPAEQSKTTLSSQFGNLFGDKEEAANGLSIFGSSKDGSEEDAAGDISSQPVWAKTFYGLGVTAAIATVIGLVVGPVMNFIQYGPQTQLFR